MFRSEMLVGTMTDHNYSGQDTQLQYHPRISRFFGGFLCVKGLKVLCLFVMMMIIIIIQTSA